MQQQALQNMQVQQQLQHMQMQMAAAQQQQLLLQQQQYGPAGRGGRGMGLDYQALSRSSPSSLPGISPQCGARGGAGGVGPGVVGGGGACGAPPGASCGGGGGGGGGCGLPGPGGSGSFGASGSAVTACGASVMNDVSARASKELTMSPKTRAVYKAFSNRLRSKETLGKGMGYAQELADRCMVELPQAVHWRVYLELADLAKREKNFRQARRLYRHATELQRTAAQTWLEYAKMEEERGHFERCQRILTAGLQYCPHHEALMLKAIKHLERMGELPKARALLGKLSRVPISQSWRTLLEGALLEARASQTATARRIFKYLLQQAPWYGPVWHEACRFEQRNNHLRDALQTAEKGLGQLPRYGPLWFCALRLYESTTPAADLVRSTRALVDRGVKHISKDLVWKLWFECAQVEERAGHLQRARMAYVKSVANCAANLRWKVWLGGARTELCHGQFETAQALLDRALSESPPKTRALVMLEQSRLAEFGGNVEHARKLLKSARRTNRQEWKVYLESVLLEIRCQETGRALRVARRALDVHRGTGRLWAVLIMLEHENGIERQLQVFQRALLEVPKSGEVWCEGARICLNPYSPCFSLEVARNFLDFAIEFTPQYGDSFVEYLRLELLTSTGDAQLERLWQLCINAEPNYGTLLFHCKASPLQSTRQVLHTATEIVARELTEWHHVYASAKARSATPAFRAAADAAAQKAMSTQGDGQLPKLELPPLEVQPGPPSEPADFVTGSVGLNRMQRRCSELTPDEQRGLIYGGDMVVP
jgi:tetratricopeptide (TPR) repeat protein/type II secretory pathway pseudopilin PulG